MCLLRKTHRTSPSPSPEKRSWRSRLAAGGRLCLPHRHDRPADRLTARDWLVSLVVPDADHPRPKPDPSTESEIFGSHQTAECVGIVARNALLHHSGMLSQCEMPRVQRATLSLHLTKEPRQGARLSLLNRVRLFVLRKRAVWLRKHCEVEEIYTHPHGLPQFEELYALTSQHVAFNRRKLFDVVLPIESRRYAADSILNDFDILCPIRPSPHLKQMSRLRDRKRLCLIGRSTIGIPFEASDFMARWVYCRCLQTSELYGLQLFCIKEEANLEEDYDLSKIGQYRHSKCLASKLVSARRSAQTANSSIRSASSSSYTMASQNSFSQIPSLHTITEEHSQPVEGFPSLSAVDETHEQDASAESTEEEVLQPNHLEKTADLGGDGPGHAVHWVALSEHINDEIR